LADATGTRDWKIRNLISPRTDSVLLKALSVSEPTSLLHSDAICRALVAAILEKEQHNRKLNEPGTMRDRAIGG
jgi:hypothetical protein